MLVLATAIEGSTIPALVKTVFESILEVFLVCIAGYVLARRGILDVNTRKQLNRVNVSLFTPALLFSKVAFFLSPAKLRELWIVPLIFLLVTVVSMAIAWCLGRLFRLRRSQRNFAIAAAMFMNTNSLPIALMQSLVVTVSGLKWGTDDSEEAMLGRALTYLMVHSTLGMILRWSFGVHLLTQADDELAAIPDTPAVEQPPAVNGLASPPQNGIGDAGACAKPSGGGNGHLRPPPLRRDTSAIGRNPAFFHSFPYVAASSPSSSGRQSPRSMDSTTENEDADVCLPAPTPQTVSWSEDEVVALPMHSTQPALGQPAPPGAHARTRSRVRAAAGVVVRGARAVVRFMTAPLWAAIVSLVVACVPPVQYVFDEHMAPLRGAISHAGACSIPVTLVVLGAFFVPPPRAAPAWAPKDTGKRGEGRTVLAALLARMVVAPAVLLPLTWLFAKFELHQMFDDPVFVVSTVLVISSPPAITLAQMTQQASGDAFERLVSRTIFWAYLVATPPLTIAYVVLGLYMTRG